VLALVIVAGVVVVLLVAGIVGYLIFRPYLSGEHPASLSTPDELVGLTLSDDPVLTDAALELAARMSEEVGFGDVVAAFYLDPAADERLVLLSGGTTLLRNPGGELEAAFEGARDTGVALSEAVDVDPGPLGGVARCGVADLEGLSVTMCGWADHGSLVVGIFFERPVDESARLLRDIRAEILTR
jgi:hypothetical protein